MRAGVNYSIHVQVQVVKLDFVWIGFACINRYANSIALLCLSGRKSLGRAKLVQSPLREKYKSKHSTYHT